MVHSFPASFGDGGAVDSGLRASPGSEVGRGGIPSRIGDAMVGDQEATLYEVAVDRHDRRETYYQWVDEARQLLLKLVSLDRDWSVEYGRVVLSTQPDYFFETPLGYRTFEATEKQADEG